FRDETGQSGEFTSTGVSFAFAYNLHLTRSGNNVITVGGLLGGYQKNIDFGKFQWSSQYNPLIGYDGSTNPEISGVDNSVFYPTVSIGMMWNYKSKKRYELKEFGAFTGFSIENLNEPNASFFSSADGELARMIKLHGGFSIFLNKRLDVSPNYLIQY
ncbi:type IX secretion system membrane protein PorP/SprF, partial [Fulvivirga sp. RKSG066]|uniref:type IX secretion system membrane protein PorP/SprF n=1 Tax=Fulvivirga aurantia TaxID=2529383 RepID=UPI0012BD094C